MRFVSGSDRPVKDLGPGIRRQILGYTSELMLVKVFFDAGAESPRHHHPHHQVSTVIQGRFKIEIDGEIKTLSEGDSFAIPENVMHQAICLEQGVLLDAFSPMREDFLE